MDEPTTDGQVLEYRADTPTPLSDSPRIYYVNGIQTDGAAHAAAAMLLSEVTNRVIYGVYNATAGDDWWGWLADLMQCKDDWVNVFVAKLAEFGNRGVNAALNAVRDLIRGKHADADADPENIANEIRQKLPLDVRIGLVDAHVSHNQATTSLFRELRTHQGMPQWIVAHSQGNLIAADALWAMVLVFGEISLANMEVFSLASPAPAWPLGIRHRRKVYGHTNDIVTLADPHNWPGMNVPAGGKFGRTAGDWQQFGKNPLPGTAAHDLNVHLELRYFITRIRIMLGLPPFIGPLPKV